jgi:hypothetical protein
VLSYPGVGAEHTLALRALADLGIAVELEREADGGELCIIEGRGRKVVGRGATADAAAGDALAIWRFGED